MAYRWTSAFPGEELREDNSPPRSQNLKDHTEGWPLELDALKTRAEQPST
ncbi:hypothetical protein ACH4M4_31580 [Streptomyces sp. NPDC017254]